MPADAPRGVRYERRYWQVIDAAAAVFAEKGYQGASTKDIAQRLQIRQGSLYYYFSSKEAALEEVCYRGVQGFVQNLEAIVGGDGGAIAKIRAAVRNHVEPLRDRPDYVRVFLKQRHNLPADSRRKIGALSRQYERLVETLLERGVASGELRSDLDCRLAALALIGLCNSVPDWHGKRPPSMPLEAVAEQYASWFLAGVSARTQ